MTSIPDRVDVHLVEHHSDQATALAAEGPPEAVAAWLRAMANRYDPPRPATHGDSPGPASGLRMDRRDTPDHRNPNRRSNYGFAPVKAMQMGDSEP